MVSHYISFDLLTIFHRELEKKKMLTKPRVHIANLVTLPTGERYQLDG